jgi:putative phosphoribosyl transferase
LVVKTVAEVMSLKVVPIPFTAFMDRSDAGVKLAQFVGAKSNGPASILALPRGGIPVAQPLAETLNAPLEPIFVRKLPIPESPEAGFGAVAIDGSRVLNENLLAHLNLSEHEIDRITEDVLEEVRRRAQEYMGKAQLPDIRGRRVYIVDDGLASGYTCIAAAQMVQKYNPQSLVLTVPVAPQRTVRVVENLFQEVHCLFIQTGGSFAVASFYNDFHEMSDKEVLDILKRHRNRNKYDF